MAVKMGMMSSAIYLLAFVVMLQTVDPVVGIDNPKMVCYFSSWAVYRPGFGKFDVDNLDPYLCTHLIFGFAALDNYTMDKIIAYDPWNELCPNEPGGGMCAYKRFNALKLQNPNLKTLIAIGGWNEGSEKYSKMAASPTKRANFVTSVVGFLLKYGFDGLDMDWEYPGMRGGNPAIDKANFITLLRQLKAAFAPFGFLLTSAVSPGQVTIEIAYDIPALSEVLDHLHIMGYDYHGAWENETGLNSPLYGNEKYDVANESTLNLDWTVNYYLDHGADPSKMILGVPLYGRGFTLDDPSKNGLKAPASKPIPGGPYTREDGSWSYIEIATRIRNDGDWKVVRDSCFGVPYATRGNLWIGYDDLNSLTTKAQLAVAKKLGGALVWTIDYDDYRGEFTSRSLGLTRTVKDIIFGGLNYPIPTKCEAPTTTTRATTPTTTTPTTTTPTTTTPTTTTPTTTTPTTTTPTTTTPTTTTPTTTTTRTTTTTPTTTTPTTTTTRTTTTTPTTTTPTTTTTTVSTTKTTKPTTTTTTPTTEDEAPVGVCGESIPEIAYYRCVDDPRRSYCAASNGKHWLVSHPTSCSFYLQCVFKEDGYYIYVMPCSRGLVYNPVLQVCDRRINVPNCS